MRINRRIYCRGKAAGKGVNRACRNILKFIREWGENRFCRRDRNRSEISAIVRHKTGNIQWGFHHPPLSAGSLSTSCFGMNNARIFGDETIRPMKERAASSLPRGHSGTRRVNSEASHGCAKRTHAHLRTRRRITARNPLQRLAE